LRKTCPLFSCATREGRRTLAMKTNASIRRFLYHQRLMQRDAPPELIERYECYVWCVARDEFPKSFREWLED